MGVTQKHGIWLQLKTNPFVSYECVTTLAFFIIKSLFSHLNIRNIQSLVVHCIQLNNPATANNRNIQLYYPGAGQYVFIVVPCGQAVLYYR